MNVVFPDHRYLHSMFTLAHIWYNLILIEFLVHFNMHKLLPIKKTETNRNIHNQYEWRRNAYKQEGVECETRILDNILK
jgi:hypothetical protein